MCESESESSDTAILIIIEGQFQLFQRFSCSKLVLKTAESRFDALNYYENGSTSSSLIHTVAQSFPFKPCASLFDLIQKQKIEPKRQILPFSK